MKIKVLTQKNVCAFLGLIMALTIVFSASATGQQVTHCSEMALKEEFTAEDEALRSLPVVDLSHVKVLPSITVINKYGEVVAEFYGEKSELMQRFKETFTKSSFLTASGKHEFYLVN